MSPAQTAICEPLLNAATIDLYRQNAFRITGLAVDASMREVNRHADKLKLMEELGDGKSVHYGGFALDTPPSVDEIRTAIQRLKDPELRMVDEFFWFWPESFGASGSDPAIQALTSGDRDKALEIWMEQEDTSEHSISARHNLAVLWHLVALEWEDYADDESVDAERQRKIEGYWRDSFRHWEILAEDDGLWALVRDRGQQLDDARLTAGFTRRMRATLPAALDKINAALAVRHAQRGRIEAAQLHVRFMKETHEGLDNIEGTAAQVLSPVTARLQEQIKYVRSRQPTEDTLQSLHTLMDEARRCLGLYDLFFDRKNTERNDLSDEVALQCHQTACAYRNATENDLAALAVLRAAVVFAVSEDLKRRYQQAFETLQENAAAQRLEPIFKELDRIDVDKTEPWVKLAAVKDLMTNLRRLALDTAIPAHVLDNLKERMAVSLRRIALAANNDHEDHTSALEAIALASGLTSDPNAKARLDAEGEQIARNGWEAEQHNLLLNIRSDVVEVTREKIRYNDQVIQSADVQGIRYGVLRQTSGVVTESWFQIGVWGAGQPPILVECKRFFRSTAQAQSDFESIVRSIHYHLVPPLVSRLARLIVGGSNPALGKWTMTREGLLSPPSFWSKKTHQIPWEGARFGMQQGSLFVSSAYSAKSAQFNCMNEWNAVILEPLQNKVVELLRQPPPLPKTCDTGRPASPPPLPMRR